MIPKAAVYTLIDRDIKLARTEWRLKWIPFTGSRRAAVAEERRVIGNLLCPPVAPSPRAIAEWEALKQAEACGVSYGQYRDGARRAKWEEWQIRKAATA